MARGQAGKAQTQTGGKGQTQAVSKPKTQAAAKAKTQGQAPVRQQEQGSDVVFALDIGTRSIIGMVGIVEESKVRIIAVEQEEHTERAMIDGQIENIEKVSALAGKVKKRLESKTHMKLSRVCVAAAGRALRTKRAEFELDLSGTQLIDDEIVSRLEAGAITRAEEAFDAENEAAEDTRRFYLVGYTVCQYFLDDYMISNLKDHRGRHVKVDLIATFLPSEVVESLYTTMNKINLEVASLTLEPIAAINAAIPENIRLLNLVLVDIGAGTSDIAACTGGSVTGYTMATVAGDEVTETIMKEYLVDFSTAEEIKAQLDVKEEITFSDILGMEHTMSRDEIFQCIQGTSGFLCKEIADKILEINGGAPSALFLAGGGSKLSGLKEGLTTALGMDGNRVAVAGNYFKANAVSDEYDLNNPEYATPLGIAVSSGLNMINDSFRVILNNRPAKLFRSGSFTALNLLMMNGYNFRDILGRPGLNLTVTVNGARKVFYGTSSEPATLLINQKEGKLSEIIHAGDSIDFVPAVQGVPAKACLGDIEGAKGCLDITLNGIHVPMNTPLNNGDVIHIILPGKSETEGNRAREEASEGRMDRRTERDTEQSGREGAETEGSRTGGNRAGGAGTESSRAEEAEVERSRAEGARAEGFRAEGFRAEESRMEGSRAEGTGRSRGAEGRRGRQEDLETRRNETGRPWEEEIPTRGLRISEEASTAEGVGSDEASLWETEISESDERRGGESGEADHRGNETGREEAGGRAAANRPAAEPGTERGAMATASAEAESPGVPSALARLGRFGGQVAPVRAEKSAPVWSESSSGSDETPVSVGRNGSEFSSARQASEGEGSASDAVGQTESKVVAQESVAAMSAISQSPSLEAAISEREAKQAVSAQIMPEPVAPAPKVKNTIVFQMNGSRLELPKKADGRPYYLMDMIQYSGINLEKPKGVVRLTVNGTPGMFQQTLAEGDVIRIEEERR